MEYAIIQLGGKQFKVSKGDTLELERQKALKPDVLLYVNGGKVSIGDPYLSEVIVSLDVVEEKRSKKVRVARFKSKSRHRRVKGHRQPLSVLKVSDISKASTKKSVSTDVSVKKASKSTSAKGAKSTKKSSTKKEEKK